MHYKIVIENKINTKVKGFYNDANGVARAFNFELTQERLSQDEIKEVVGDKSETTTELLKRITSGWKGQRLVLTEDDKPAEFNAESFDVLLNVAGMANYCFQAYVAQVVVNEKN